MHQNTTLIGVVFWLKVYNNCLNDIDMIKYNHNQGIIMLTIKKIKQAVAKIGKKYGIKNAYLFGSYANGSATENSDVDIIIDDGGNIRSLFELSGFRLELIDELGGVDVDILTMDGVKPKFYNIIKNDRMLVYGK